ncbi:MAG: 50S ribosomal protein L23 [Omnitrophica bacterium RIFCSPLOWO2_12_FULL_44_17]|uniref:Large ribosomal subunit protein uL23 n=1 Tax=Candidatus Danuiimicrobium aquiferis TaxID=1801832 RepID=A0A1G1KZZ2_9BACT|nr:MAG: 50S ribosomal protein L23 [Omnitrophica bacterium RIFCSPHIGHO2_02_FULL_45_28]OGW91763.1 MAG: 50S ribosomal protein L23 [Omnitrophica bacterium RIFCSPHIGHO2_12_FULL_44_12]OGW98467.1 MAG: 50S ribosomal protein L23 [Omnitrophica bacterium RIFCSPLOWO2_12_FULL_44_17]OGX02914.1 MAG: 50S ribosomal protein L23 [Omnitrophica bacterium RIFCSPLOWO2_02_FULL_44_11]
MNIYDVIQEPLISEKGSKHEKQRKYYFKVSPKAQKHEIQDAVEKIFNVKVKKVNTMIVGGKWKRVRFRPGKTAEWKKAIVTLKEGQKISLT